MFLTQILVIIKLMLIIRKVLRFRFVINKSWLLTLCLHERTHGFLLTSIIGTKNMKFLILLSSEKFVKMARILLLIFSLGHSLLNDDLPRSEYLDFFYLCLCMFEIGAVPINDYPVFMCHFSCLLLMIVSE